jgi:hypothetical protein
MNFPVLDITGFFFCIRTQVTALVLRTSAFTRVLMRKKKPVISNTDRFFCFNSTVSYTYIHRFKFTYSSVLNINYTSSEILVSCLVYCFFKQIVDIFFNEAYYQESYILIIEYNWKDLEIFKYKRESKAR